MEFDYSQCLDTRQALNKMKCERNSVDQGQGFIYNQVENAVAYRSILRVLFVILAAIDPDDYLLGFKKILVRGMCDSSFEPPTSHTTRCSVDCEVECELYNETSSQSDIEAFIILYGLHPAVVRKISELSTLSILSSNTDWLTYSRTPEYPRTIDVLTEHAAIVSSELTPFSAFEAVDKEFANFMKTLEDANYASGYVEEDRPETSQLRDAYYRFWHAADNNIREEWLEIC